MSTLRSSGRLRDGIPRERTARRKYSRVDVRLKDASTREDRRSDRKRKEETCPRDAGPCVHVQCAIERAFFARVQTGPDVTRHDTTRRGRRDPRTPTSRPEHDDGCMCARIPRMIYETIFLQHTPPLWEERIHRRRAGCVTFRFALTESRSANGANSVLDCMVHTTGGSGR